ncbi:septum formation protein Maf [Altererythrobacter sp. SALINAS58]|uniref:Maf family protein n=1 Tax=Alteripontixanthobacter muriae TaxID=2705546 RepID=UPI0015767BF4|nr:Maf family nucleotide pyrophosphatase [Alteripontixanthobacter muriae]NTZ43535.1 septum formation protein Maf [Alteripontixanthobacter muriae]
MLVLASKSASRQDMLRAAGVLFEPCPADVDERALEAKLGDASAAEVAGALALKKARNVADRLPGRLVLGSDSLVSVAGRRFDKPGSRQAAAEHLRFFSGRTMHLHSAAALVRGEETLWQHTALAKLQIRELSEDFIAHYLDMEWPAITHCAGAFRIEGQGVQLFAGMEGDMFTVLGMPLVPVLAALRDLGTLPS